MNEWVEGSDTAQTWRDEQMNEWVDGSKVNADLT